MNLELSPTGSFVESREFLVQYESVRVGTVSVLQTYYLDLKRQLAPVGLCESLQTLAKVVDQA
jgi:hypothetical protein